ncbi:MULTISPECIES: hypothetical protein [unclassified Ensifer]|uniref:hypothetical protein n=1 Tax=unclassified Ensifer TaxID=2633371 RepID=UPI000712849D|nr:MULTISPECIES: hypothetical protein [unclassified Ensifer]KQZ41862.1 hypothetical protein ASD63_16835 [Ensifer sp. Root558]SFH29789.1 hypothetical protein SAMN05216459_12439 [Ensifer sp. OV372]
MEIPWHYIHENFDWLGHIVEALCIAAVVAVPGMLFYSRRDAVIIALAFGAGHFHGREKRDYEISVHMPPPHLEAYNFWLWNWDQATDFWPVALVVFALLLLIARKQKGRGS